MNLRNSPYKVDPANHFDKEVVVPTSKSHANRVLIIGALRGAGFTVRQTPNSTDVTTMITCLKKVGLLIEQTENEIVFKNSFPSCENETTESVIDLYSGDGGTTNRFLIALLSRGKKTYRFFPTEKMSERPINDLLEPLKQLEVNINLNLDQSGPWLTMQGPASMINTSKIQIDCQKSTQFASAMMLAFDQLPLTIDMVNVEASSTYIDLTQEILKRTRASQLYTVPVDFSSLSYPAAFGAVLGKCLITNCDEIDQLQSDSKFLDLLKEIGTKVEISDMGLLISNSGALKPFNIQVKNYPDLFPTLVFLAAHIEGKSSFSHLEILKHKESDRLSEMLKLLSAFKVDHEYDVYKGVLTITGKPYPANYPYAQVKPARDHRIVMVAYLFMRANNGGELFESDCVEKSFPGFFTQLE